MSFHSLVLDDLRNEEKGRIRKTPFEHQLDAFEAMKKCFDFDKDQGKGALLVLPTGAGKTFTTVKWVCDNVVSRNTRLVVALGYSLRRSLVSVLVVALPCRPSR